MPNAGAAGFAQGLAGGLKTGIDLGMEIDRRKKQEAKDAEAQQRQNAKDAEEKANRERDDAIRLGQLGIQQAQETRMAKSSEQADLDKKRERLMKAHVGMMYEGLSGPDGLQTMLQFNQDMQRDLGIPEDRHWASAEMQTSPGKALGDIVVTRRDGKKEVYSGEMIVRDMVKAGNMDQKWAEWKIFGTMDDHQYLDAITPEFDAVRKQYDSLNRALSAIPEKERRTNPRAAALKDQISKIEPQYDHLWSQVQGAHENIRKKTKSHMTGGVSDNEGPGATEHRGVPTTPEATAIRQSPGTTGIDTTGFDEGRTAGIPGGSPPTGSGLVDGARGPVTPPDDMKAKKYQELISKYEAEKGSKLTPDEKKAVAARIGL